MRRLGIVIGSLLILLCIGYVTKRLCAQELDPPGRMSLEDAANIRADVAEINAATAALRPTQDDLKARCEKYRIEPDQLGVSVGINFKTGEIARKAALAKR